MLLDKCPIQTSYNVANTSKQVSQLSFQIKFWNEVPYRALRKGDGKIMTKSCNETFCYSYKPCGLHVFFCLLLSLSHRKQASSTSFHLGVTCYTSIFSLVLQVRDQATVARAGRTCRWVARRVAPPRSVHHRHLRLTTSQTRRVLRGTNRTSARARSRENKCT